MELSVLEIKVVNGCEKSAILVKTGTGKTYFKEYQNDILNQLNFDLVAVRSRGSIKPEYWQSIA